MNRRLALKLLGSAPAWAQRSGHHAEPAAELPPVVLDAVVTDAQGNPVPDLAPADFAIYEGAQPRTVVAFAAVDAVSGAARSAAPLPLPLHTDPGELHRTIMLVVDDAGISADGAAALRSALAKFVNEQLGPRDTAALLRSADGNGLLEHLTSDRRQLAAALARVAFNPAAGPPPTPAWPETLRYALEGLRTVRGRKAVALFWEQAPEKYDYDPIIALANRAWSSIYPVYLGQAPAPPAEGIARLAAETGGLSLPQALSAAPARVLRDQESYYLLGFQAEASSTGQPLSVKLSRPGLQLRSRRGLPVTVPPSFESPDGSPTGDLRRIIASPLDSGSLHLGLSAIFSHAPTGNWLDVVLLMDLHEVAVTHKLDGIYQAGLDFLLLLVDMNGGVTEERTATHAMPLTADDYQRALDNGLNYAIRLPAAKPGLLQVRVAARDATNANTGIAHRLVEVPDVSQGALLLSGIVLELADQPAGAAKGSAIDAVRGLFHPGEHIAYRCSIYNASADSQKRVALEVQTSMYSGAETIYTGPPMRLTAAETGSQQALNVLGKLDLGQHMVPGEFVLRVLVTDKMAPGDKPRTASQWTHFTVR